MAESAADVPNSMALSMYPLALSVALLAEDTPRSFALAANSTVLSATSWAAFVAASLCVLRSIMNPPDRSR
ncbi:MAG: hypothetical protein DRJ28_09495 [Actinobacteria bacterium]|nr:MAG: hypothetical protein DRJ28_09495 [Actinomycetota bacterium]